MQALKKELLQSQQSHQKRPSLSLGWRNRFPRTQDISILKMKYKKFIPLYMKQYTRIMKTFNRKKTDQQENSSQKAISL